MSTDSAPAATAGAPSAPQATPQDFFRALVIAVVIAVPISLLALGFVALSGWLNDVIWRNVPDALGMGDEPAWWWLLLVPVVLGVLVALARKLPGHADHGPLDGFAKHTDPRHLPGILLAALLTLSSGAILGPEAPLLALGTGLGLLFAYRAKEPVREMSSAAGGFAAFSALLANPLVTAMFLLESTSATVSSIALLPGLLASGVGYLVFTGIGSFAGIATPTFVVPGLPAYGSVQFGDLAQALLVAAVAGALALAAMAVGRALQSRISAVPMLVAIPTAGLVIGALSLLWVSVSGQPYSVFDFSGEAAIPALIAESSASTVLLLLALKSIGYAISLGSGFRGGPIFPVLFLGVAVGVLASLVLPIGLTPAVAAAMAASTAAATRLPFAASALSLIMLGTSGAATTVLTIVGAVTGFVVSRVLGGALQRRAEQQSGAGPTGSTAPAAS
jgi:H+/Cl- antiporter ClcA